MTDGTSCGSMKLPDVPSELSVTLPTGGDLKAFADFSQGIPTDCSLSFNLMVQLAPALASMSCLLAMINVMKVMKDLAETAQINPPGALDKIGDLIEAIGKVVPCFTAVTGANIFLTIKGVLETVIKFLKCLISQIESVIDFENRIDMTLAVNNPTLKSVLNCAMDNKSLAMDHLMAAVGPVQPLMTILDSFESFTNHSLGLPDLEELSSVADPSEAIDAIKQVVEKLEDVLAALPG